MLELCRKHQLPDALALLLERSGEYEQAFALIREVRVPAHAAGRSAPAPTLGLMAGALLGICYRLRFPRLGTRMSRRC